MPGIQDKSHRPQISVVVPVYKEEANIGPFLKRLVPVLEKIGEYEILFSLDPSPDKTEAVIQEAINRNPNIGLLVFSRRFGQPAATMAGILNCKGEACVVIDVDLQDPPELIEKLYAKIQEGYEAVYAKRRSRQGESWIKLWVSAIGYRLINSIADIPIPRDTGDFRIISRRVIEELRRLNESHGFLRGLVAFVGFKQTSIEYDRDKRFSGKGNYNPFLGSLKIGINGMVGFSNFLLSVSWFCGLLMFGLGILVVLYIVIAMFVFKFQYPLGVPTIISLIILMGGVQLMCIGVVGEYIGRIYDEVKRRPQFIIDRRIDIP